MKNPFLHNLTQQAKRRGGLALLIPLLVLAFTSGLAGCSPKKSQPGAASVVERNLAAKSHGWSVGSSSNCPGQT